MADKLRREEHREEETTVEFRDVVTMPCLGFGSFEQPGKAPIRLPPMVGSN